MPKGKKFDAAQVHFEKFEDQYKKETRQLRIDNRELFDRCVELETEVHNLRTFNNRLVDDVFAMVNYLGMTKEQFELVVHQNESLAELRAMLSFFKKTPLQ